MSKTLSYLLVVMVLHCSASLALGQRVFLVPSGDSPLLYTSGNTVVALTSDDVQAGNFTLTFDIYADDFSLPTKVFGYQITLHNAVGGTTGTIERSGITLPMINSSRSEYIFAMPSGPTATYVHNPALAEPAQLVGGVGLAGDSRPFTAPVYLGEITYTFTADAFGSFTIDFIDAGTTEGTSKTVFADDGMSLIAFTADGVAINITEPNSEIPTVSDWGIVALTLLLLVAGTLIIRQHKGLQVMCVLLLVGAIGVVGSTALACLPADLNGSGNVGSDDIDQLTAAWGPCVSCPEDLNGDGEVSLLDMLAVLAAWGPVDPFPAEYEPGTWSPSLVALGEGPRAGDANPMVSVYGYSGEFYQSTVDHQIQSRGFNFVWSRKYRSRLSATTRQGYGWDFSYNIFVEVSGLDLVLHDGNSRVDTYENQGNGTWSRDEFFREITKNMDNTYTVEFANKGTWNLNALDGSLAGGKIASIVDRTGNTMTFDYDGGGRLIGVHDTLDIVSSLNRVVTIAYDGNGMISTVTDWSGREIRYEYYDGFEAGGNAGDLKSVRSPLVTGNSGTNFPNGKTTTYTYSTGFADERLNHNLLTISDGRGQVYLINKYINVTDACAVEFDRIESHHYGDTGDTLNINYAPTLVCSGTSATINDRVGNVSIYCYDVQNRMTDRHEYTGRAPDADSLTDFVLSFNTPTPASRVRPADPAIYASHWMYNDDSLVSSITYPNGNSVEYTYDPAAAPRARGNLCKIRQIDCPLIDCPLNAFTDADIVTLFEYNSGINTDHNFVTRHVDGRLHATTHQYDAEGNRTQTRHRITSIVENWEYNSFGQVTAHVLPDNDSTGRRRDEFNYFAMGASVGYRQNVVVDAGGTNLTTTYSYDSVGNVTSMTDPRGKTTTFEVNQLNQIVRTTSAEVTDGSGIQYDRVAYYDANNNVVRVDVQNKNEAGTLLPNEYFTTLYEYDVLNFVTRSCTEDGNHIGIPGPLDQPTCVGVGMPTDKFITTEYVYDANRNNILTRSGESVEHRQDDNAVRAIWDERDKLFQVTSGLDNSDPTASVSGKSSTQYDYDGNENLVATRSGIEDGAHATATTVDGFNRTRIFKDAQGNRRIFEYDANSNLCSTRLMGELIDIPGDVDNIRLSESNMIYDDMDRMTDTNIDYFDPSTQNAIGDGLQSTQIVYSRTSQVISVTNDNGNTKTTTLDTVNRPSTVTDAVGNTITYGYDENSNITSLTSSEASLFAVTGFDSFSTAFAYDNLNRRIQTTDNKSNTTTNGYDSRGNRLLHVDALGKESRYSYDGINRHVSTIHDMDSDGADGDGVDITTTTTYDDNGRVTSTVDDNGNKTRYAYDNLNRRIVISMADETLEQVGVGAVWTLGVGNPDLTGFTRGYNVHHVPITKTDANGTQVTNAFDSLNRLTGVTVDIFGPGVANTTTTESFAYDGLSRLVSAENNGSLMTRTYDSLSNLSRETLNYDAPSFGAANNETVIFTRDGVGNATSIEYPGARLLTNTFDALERAETIIDGATTLATFSYAGPNRLERIVRANDTRSTYKYDGASGVADPSGDSGVKQVITAQHEKIGSPGFLDNRSFKWDAAYNKTQRRDLRAMVTHGYMYDDMFRLTQATVTESAIITRDTTYNLDGVGNRSLVTSNPDPDPGPHVGSYMQFNTLPSPGDAQVNQYSTTPANSREYDAAGDMTSLDDLDNQRDVTYDYRNRMVQFSRDDGLRHAYTYDALGRRSSKIVDVDSFFEPVEETRFFYAGNQVIEEQDAGGTTLASYVHRLCDGIDLDNIMMDGPYSMQRDGTDYYPLKDDMGNVMTLTADDGTVVERYTYDDYGSTRVFDGADQSISESAFGNPYQFQSLRIDNESNLYLAGSRYMDSTAGRFLSRGSDDGLGNRFTAGANNLWTNGVQTNNIGDVTYLIGSGSFASENLPGPWFNSYESWVGVSGGGGAGGYSNSLLDASFLLGFMPSPNVFSLCDGVEMPDFIPVPNQPGISVRGSTNSLVDGLAILNFINGATAHNNENLPGPWFNSQSESWVANGPAGRGGDQQLNEDFPVGEVSDEEPGFIDENDWLEFLDSVFPEEPETNGQTGETHSTNTAESTNDGKISIKKPGAR